MTNRYIRFSTVDIDTGLAAIRAHVDGEGRKEVGGQAVGLSSLRLRTFSNKGISCVYCGLKASYFAIEKCQGSKLDFYHMNLWGSNMGKEILFTHDHVHARSLGGADKMKNSVTACENCNGSKSKYESLIRKKIPRNIKKISFDELVKTAFELVTNAKIVEKFFLLKA